MSNSALKDALVLGSGPGALSIAAALASENLNIEILSEQSPEEPWPFTYGIWGEEVDDLGLSHLLEHRWINTISYFGEGDKDPILKRMKSLNTIEIMGFSIKISYRLIG